MVKSIHEIPLATVIFLVTISLSRPTRSYLALENPAMQINIRPMSTLGTCRALRASLLFLEEFFVIIILLIEMHSIGRTISK